MKLDDEPDPPPRRRALRCQCDGAHLGPCPGPENCPYSGYEPEPPEGEKMDKLSAADARSLQYFHEEKGDMSRLVSWGQLKPVLQRDYPEVLAAREQVRVAQRTLDAVVKAMVFRAEVEEGDE